MCSRKDLLRLRLRATGYYPIVSIWSDIPLRSPLAPDSRPHTSKCKRGEGPTCWLTGTSTACYVSFLFTVSQKDEDFY